MQRAVASYFAFGGLLPRFLPDTPPVWLGPLGGLGLLEAACARAANEPLATLPPFDLAVAD